MRAQREREPGTSMSSDMWERSEVKMPCSEELVKEEHGGYSAPSVHALPVVGTRLEREAAARFSVGWPLLHGACTKVMRLYACL
jgi:hypothetical protein